MSETFTYDPSNDPAIISAAEERDADTLAVAEQLEQEQGQLLAGKYKSAQDLEQAYIELQKKLGSNETNEEPQEEVAESETEEPVDPIVSVFEAADEEFLSKGELTPETLNKLSEISSKDLIEAYLKYEANLPEAPAGVELSNQQIDQIQSQVGGPEQYQKLVEWASTNFSEAEIQSFDNVMETGNVDAINFAIQALKSRYTDAVGFEGNMVQGKAAASKDTFRSQAELVRAMNDPRYDKDPAYRMEVMQKLEDSDLIF